jgi:hypothetical protein
MSYERERRVIKDLKIHMMSYKRERRESRNVSIRLCLVPSKKIITSLHRMFGHMYGILNIDKKTNYTVWLENYEMNILNLISP